MMQRLKTGVSAIINFSLPASGLGVTVHFLIQGQWLEAFAAGTATVGVTLLTLGRKFTKRVLARLESRLDERADSLGDWLFDQIEVRVQKLWWVMSGNFRDRYNNALIYRYRDYRTQGLTNKGPFALNLEKVFVPLQLRPESLSRISSAMVKPAVNSPANSPVKQSNLLERRGKASPASSGSTIWAFLAALKQQPAFDRLVILGAPGSGKTTLLEHLTLIYARGKQRKHDRNAPDLIPMLLYLREVRNQLISETPPDLLTLLEGQANQDRLQPPPGWFAEQLRQGKALVLLDGLDEVADVRHRKQVSRWVDQQMRRYRETPFILTSRPSGYRDAPLEGITTLEVRPFDLGQMQRFVYNWYLQNETVRHLGKRDRGVKQRAQFQSDDLMDRISKTPALAAMALNPLLLSMIATVHCFRGALPGRRVELYAEICDVLLGRRQDVKGISDVLTTSQKRQILQTLALKLMSRRSRTFKTFAGKVLIQKELDRMAGGEEAIAAENFLQQIEVNSGLLVERHPGVYEFAHKSLQEYLAAQQIKQLQREYLLTRAIEDPWWEETIRLYAAQNDASALIWHALQKNSVNALSLARDCLEEGLTVDQDVKEELGDRLDDGLESKDPAIFELAAEVKLERRLKRLLRLNETTDLDLTYISCAEYQLFLNEQRRDGDTCPPDHWAKPRFPRGSALIPVTGLRASDAIAFCRWLTTRLNQLGSLYQEAGVTVFSGPITIRLPKREEVEKYPIDPPLVLLPQSNRPSLRLAKLQSQISQDIPTDAATREQSQSDENTPSPMEISCWCLTTGDRPIVAQALNNARLADTQSTIAAQCIELMLRDNGFVFDPILKHALHFSQAILAPQVSRLLNQAFDLPNDPLHWNERDRAMRQVTSLDLNTSLRDGTGLSRDAFNLDSNRDLLLHIAQEWSETGMDKVRQALDRQGRQRPKASQTPLLPAPEILLASTFWQILSGLYSNLAKRRRILKRNAIIRQDCEFLSSQYQTYSEDALRFYLFMALKDDRRNNEEAIIWEGLRIVRTTRQ